MMVAKGTHCYSLYKMFYIVPIGFEGPIGAFLTQSEKFPTSQSVSVGGGYDKLYSVGVP